MLPYDITIKSFILNDKNLTNSEKIFYTNLKGLIVCLGYCWATNVYLSQIAGVSSRQVRRYLEKFKKLGMIIVEVTRDKSGRVLGRKIYTRESFSDRHEIARVYGENPLFKDKFSVDMDVHTPMDMDVRYRLEHNSTSKKKIDKERGVGETKRKDYDRQADQSIFSLNKNKEAPPPEGIIKQKPEKKQKLPAVSLEMRKLVTEEDHKRLDEIIADKDEQEKCLSDALIFMDKMHHNAYKKDRAVDIAIRFYHKRKEEKLKSKAKGKEVKEEKGKAVVEGFIRSNRLDKDWILEKDCVVVARSPACGDIVIRFDDPELENKLKKRLRMMRQL